ncbi:MAG: ATP-binding protein [Alphaproteobacteria bacterium]
MELGRRLFGKETAPGSATLKGLIAALHALPQGFALFDARDKLVVCNPAFREVFEAGDDPIPDGASYAAVLRGAAVKGKIEGVRRDEETWLAERLAAHVNPENIFNLTLRTGRTFVVWEQRIPGGGTVVSLVEITSYERRDAASRTNEQKARAMLDSVFDGVLTIGADSVVDSVNARAAEIFGRPIETIIGNSVGTIFPDLPLSELIGDDALGGIRELKGRGPADAAINLEVAVSELPDTWSLQDRRRETRQTFVATIRDVTEQRALARQLQQAQRMDAIGTLAGGIAHDFNNILSIIMGYGGLIQQDLPEGTEARENADMVVQAARRARELVEQILTFSRHSDDQAKKPLDPKPVVKEVLKLIRSTVPATIEIVQEIGEDEGRLLGDVSQLHQIVMNLCTNAVHAMGAGPGRLLVSLTRENLDAEAAAAWGVRSGDFWHLSVADSGEGIAPDVLDRVFEPFFTTKERGQGTGLGLAVVHGIVTDHGGVVRAESRLGQGATFHVLLPVDDAEREALVDAPVSTALAGRGRILLVDDETLIVRMGQKILNRLGYTVVGATDSEEALETFRADPGGFDLLMTDQTMPGLTGDALIEAVRAIRPDLPVVLCTGYSQVMDEEKAKEMAIDAFVMKPLEREEVGRIVSTVLAARVG